MTLIAENISELIGCTPLIQLKRFDLNLPCQLYGKLEAFNPGFSVKDRIGKAMIDEAEKEGRLKPGGTIIEPTSGNTGIALALIAAVRGYRCILTMPSSMSVERRKILQALGAQLVLTESYEGMPGAVKTAEQLISEIPGSFMPQQFVNPANPSIHYKSTGPEIWDTLQGHLEVFISGVGTGGTISGVGRFLKEKKSDIHIVAVEPEESPVLSGGIMGPHMIQGIGAGFIPKNYDGEVVDEVIQVSSEKAIETAQQFGQSEGFLVGISSGAALSAVQKIARKFSNKNMVVVLPDLGERYISTPLFQRD